MVPELEPGTIVGGIDDVGFLRELELIENVKEAAHLGVNVLDGVDVGVLGIGIADVVGDIKGNVGHGMGQIDKEGLFPVGLDEIDGLLGAASGDRALVDRQLDDLFILEEGRLPLGEGRLRVVPEDVHALPAPPGFPPVVGVVHVIRVGNPVVGVETVGGREDFRVVSKVPFPEAGGGIVL